MENICSLELCNSPFYYFFLRHPDLTLHPELAPVLRVVPASSEPSLLGGGLSSAGPEEQGERGSRARPGALEVPPQVRWLPRAPPPL